jgi:hypothetical protein
MANLSRAEAQTLEGNGRHFNFNKLQAVLCMVASAALTLSLVVWAVLG